MVKRGDTRKEVVEKFKLCQQVEAAARTAFVSLLCVTFPVFSPFLSGSRVLFFFDVIGLIEQKRYQDYVTCHNHFSIMKLFKVGFTINRTYL